jgi:hypothetical protein
MTGSVTNAVPDHGRAARGTDSGGRIGLRLGRTAGTDVAKGSDACAEVRDQAATAGLQRTLWNGCADDGLRVPAGAYVVEVAARSADGGQARALTTLRLEGR